MRYKYDENKIYVETVLDDDLENTTDVRPIDGLYKATWNGTEWFEGATQEYIDNINYIPPKPKTEVEILQEKLDATNAQLETTQDELEEAKAQISSLGDTMGQIIDHVSTI